MLYVPRADIAEDLLEPTATSTHCPFKGDASYWSVRADERVAEDAMWSYPEPLPPAAWLKGYAGFYWDRLDAWFDEDEQVHGHLRDPYHRVDVRQSSRSVKVMVAGEAVAESNRPLVLSETGLPNRWYLPADDVAVERLDPSTTTTHCPYKGQATYWSVEVGGRRIDDVAWTYAEPFDDVHRIAGHLSFLGGEVKTEVEGGSAG